MAGSMTATVADIRVDNAKITVGGTDMGLTEDGVEISIDTKLVEIMGDQYGETPLNVKNAGTRVTVSFAIKESAYAKIAKIMYEATTRSTGGTAVGVGGNLAGTLDGLTRAVAIVIHPLDIANATLTNDINVFKAVPIGDPKPKLNAKKETIWQCTFLALLDTSKTSGNGLIDFGLTAATAS